MYFSRLDQADIVQLFLQVNSFVFYDSIWLGSFIDSVNTIFYRYARHELFHLKSKDFHGIQFTFMFDHNKILTVAAKYSIIEFLASATAFIIFLTKVFAYIASM